jgi:hypothetical protein
VSLNKELINTPNRKTSLWKTAKQELVEIGHVAIPFLLCSVQLIVETRLVTAGYFNRRFQKGHGGPGLAGDLFFNHV